MNPNRKRENNSEIVKRQILTAAQDILIEDGFDKLSIRKIAERIQYSPGLIYHYFQNKNEIVRELVLDGTKKIGRAISSVTQNTDLPQETLKQMFLSYVKYALSIPESIRAMVINDDGGGYIRIMGKGISETNPNIAFLVRWINIGIEKGIFRNLDPELAAQTYWITAFGLVSRLIIEKEIPDEQREKIIGQTADILIHGMLK